MLFGDRYEAAWGSLRTQSESVTLRTEQLAKTVEQAAARCGAACDGASASEAPMSRATGGTYVRGAPAIGKISSHHVTPLCPPQLAPLRNPICPWDAAYSWHRGERAFARLPCTAHVLG